jgi:hypothetical protein
MIPLAVWLIRQGHEVTFLQQKRLWQCFSSGYIKYHPNSVIIVDRTALRYVAKLAGYEHDWGEVESQVQFVRRPSYSRYDGVVGTTKSMDALRQLHANYQRPTFALGYQHIPFLAVINGRMPSKEHHVCDVFLGENTFAEFHNFADILDGCSLVPISFTYLDRVYERRPVEVKSEPWAFIFHPGGCRNVVTRPGDSKTVCYARQRVFLERVCLPLIRAGLRPIIKVHPLRAKYHDLSHLRRITADLEHEHGFAAESILCLGPDVWYWDYAFRSSVILNYGSSSIYELWSAGVEQAVVCNFEGTARSRKFYFFPELFLDSYDEYLSFIESRAFPRIDSASFAGKVFNAYHSLFNGHASSSAGQLILETIAS